jgi:hypothetical protein
MYNYNYQSHLTARRSFSRHQLGEGSQIERGTSGASPVDPEIRLLTKITCQYPQHSLRTALCTDIVYVADRVTRQYSKSLTTHATRGSSDVSEITSPRPSPLSQPDRVYNRLSSDVIMFAGSWTDSWQQETTSGEMELLVPSDQRPGDHYHHHHTLEQRTCYQDDNRLIRSDSNRLSLTSEVSQATGSYKRCEHVEHYEQHESASVHARQQTRSRSPRPRTYVTRADGQLRKSERQLIGPQEPRACVKHQDGTVCRCNSNSQVPRAGES